VLALTKFVWNDKPILQAGKTALTFALSAHCAQAAAAAGWCMCVLVGL
jgi:hypothetical protein